MGLGIWMRDGLGNGLGNGLENGLGNGLGNGLWKGAKKGARKRFEVRSSKTQKKRILLVDAFFLYHAAAKRTSRALRRLGDPLL